VERGVRITAVSDGFVLGVNYWPARTFVGMWSRFDPAQIDRDFAAVQALGLRLVRMFLFWPDFQPAPDRVDVHQLSHLAIVFDLARRHRIQLMPALIVGHMSGPNYVPAWAMSDAPNNRPAVYIVDGAISDRKPRDLYGGDTAMLDAQRLLVRGVVERFRSHPALWGWDVCNEVNFVQAPGPDAGDRWLETIVAEVRTADGAHPVTAGVVTAPEGAPRGFSATCHRVVDVASVHAYPIYDPSASGPADTAFVAERIERVRRECGVPVMLAEFGMPVNPEPGTRETVAQWAGFERRVPLIDEGAAGEYVRAVLPVARDAGATAALIWCFADYEPRLYGAPPLDTLVYERYFGIFDASGRLKATGVAMRDFAATL
jgi:endo-1,4-beta-mannosidase